MKKIGDVISKKRKELGMSQSDLAERLLEYDIRIKNAAVSSWEKNVNTPTAYQLLALCEIFGITDIYSEFISDTNTDVLSGLNSLGKQRVLEYIRLLKQSEEFSENKQKNKELLKSEAVKFYRRMPIAVLPASAGLGELVGDEMFEEQDIYEYVPPKAKFGVRLNGDSMEPTYRDGDIVWIQPAEIVDSGKIGLFFLDGLTYCKRLKVKNGKTYLISDNKKYKPIELSQSSNFKVYGVVVNGVKEK